MATTKKMNILRGKTYLLPIRFEVEPVISKPITAISTASGFPRLTVPGHGAPNGWSGYVIGVDSPRQINAGFPVRDCDFRKMTVIDANTIEFNELDASGFKAYVSGGFLQYRTPVDLTGYTGRMKIKDKVGGTVLLSSSAPDAPLNVIDIAVNNTAKTITLTVHASATTDISWSRGVYDLEMVSSDLEPVATRLISGKVSVIDEVTT